MQSSLEAAAAEPVKRRWTIAQFSWVLCDAARDPYISLITAFIFPAYFVQQLVGDPIEGQALWGLAMGISMLLTGILGPLLGSVADQMGSRKPWIAFLIVVGTATSCGLWFAEPGQTGVVILAMVLATVALTANEASLVFTNALLPTLADKSQFGRLSGIGWALGFASSMLMLFFFQQSETIQQSGWMGFEFNNFELERFSAVLSGLWFALFLAPVLIFAPDVPKTGLRLSNAIVEGLTSLVRTFLAVRRFRNVLIFLVGNALAAGVVITFYFFTGIYAAELFDWGVGTLGLIGLETTLGATVFALFGGVLDDRIGGKRTLLIATAGSAVILALMASVTPTGIGSLALVSETTPSFGIFGSPPELIYHVLNFLQGGTMGMILTSGRSILSRIAAPSMLGEFYGLEQMFTRVASFVAPILVAYLTTAYQSQRIGIFSIMIGMSVLSFALLYFVVEEQSDRLH